MISAWTRRGNDEKARLLEGMLETAKLSAAELDARQMRRTIRRYCGRRAVSAFAFNDAARVMRLLMGRILPPGIL
jgi:hypothetical protein